MSIKANIKRSRFTSCFLVGNKMNGQILPTIMFTSDLRFRPTSIPGTVFHQFGVHKWQIVFIDIFFEGKLPEFVSERKDFTMHGILLWSKHCRTDFGFLPDLVFLTDNGASFKMEKDSLLATMGARGHCFLASLSHQYLSTLDNGANSKTKQAWRAANNSGEYPYEQQPQAAFNMIRASQSHTESQIKHYWNRNFMLDVEDLDAEGFESLQCRFHGIPQKWATYHAQCIREFELFKDKKGPYQQGPIMGLGQRKNTGPNGVYWTSPRVPKRGRLNTDSDI